MIKVRSLRLFSLNALISTAFFLQLLSSTSLLAGVYPDPACEQQCNDNYIFCLDYYCDPRGTCTCWTDYQNCVSYCPQICEEPKSYRDYNVVSYENFQTSQTYGCFKPFAQEANTHQKATYQKRTKTYRETTHCDGSKTTQLINSVLSTPIACWQAVIPTTSCYPVNVTGSSCP